MASDHKLYRKTRTGILWGHLTSLNQHVNTQKLCVLNLGAVVYLNFLCILNKLLSWNCQSLFCQRSFLCHFTKVCTLQRFLLYGMYLALHTHTHTHTRTHTNTRAHTHNTHKSIQMHTHGHVGWNNMGLAALHITFDCTTTYCDIATVKRWKMSFNIKEKNT